MMNYDGRNRLRHFYDKNQLIGLVDFYKKIQASGLCVLCDPDH
jgi:hypothetical protein